MRIESGFNKSLTGSNVVLVGRVTNYSCSSAKEDGYKRLWFTKMWQALRYGQRTTDVLHRFTFQSDSSTDAADFCTNGTVVNVHGIVATGASINENDMVKVVGSFSSHKGVLFARQVILNSGGRNAKVRFQHDIRSISSVLMIVLVLIAALGLWHFLSRYSSSILPFLICVAIVVLLWKLMNTRLFGALLIRGCSGKLILSLLVAILIVVCYFSPDLTEGIASICLLLFAIWFIMSPVRK